MTEVRQKLRGTTVENDAVTLPEGTITVDTDRDDLRLHDGVLLGGQRIPNLSAINALYSLPDRLTPDGALMLVTPNNYVDAGFYRVAGTEANLPIANKGTIWVGASGDTANGDVIQIYCRSTGTYMAERVRSAGAWSAWVQMVDLTTGDARYLGVGATAANSVLLNGQNAAFYTNIVARLGYTPLNKAGDVATNLTVTADPVVPLGVAPKQYVDAVATSVTDRVSYAAVQAKTYLERSVARNNVMAPSFRYLAGFQTAYISGTQMLINQGQCASISTPPAIWQGGSLSKNINAAWVAGTGVGGFDVTANIKVTAGVVYLYAIYDPTNNVADYCFSLDPANPATGGGSNIPATYTHSRLIYIFTVGAGGAIPQYTQNGDTVMLWNPANVVNAGGLGVAAVLLDLGNANIPSGYSVLAKLGGYVRDATPTAGTNGYFSSPLATAIAVGTANTQFNLGSSGGAEPESIPLALDVWTDTVRQIRYQFNQTQADITMVLNVYGWTWYRGANPA